jgi:hypothetical protein
MVDLMSAKCGASGGASSMPPASPVLASSHAPTCATATASVVTDETGGGTTCGGMTSGGMTGDGMTSGGTSGGMGNGASGGARSACGSSSGTGKRRATSNGSGVSSGASSGVSNGARGKGKVSDNAASTDLHQAGPPPRTAGRKRGREAAAPPSPDSWARAVGRSIGNAFIRGVTSLGVAGGRASGGPCGNASGAEEPIFGQDGAMSVCSTVATDATLTVEGAAYSGAGFQHDHRFRPSVTSQGGAALAPAPPDHFDQQNTSGRFA